MSISDLNFGFIGTGKITSAVASGYCNEDGQNPKHVFVSPRNAEKAAALAGKFPEQITISESNQAVVDASDVVFIGLLPHVAAAVIPKLKFRPEQRVISMMATVPHTEVSEWVAPVAPERTTISVPLPTTQARGGPILMYPRNEEAAGIYRHVGTPVEVAEEGQIKVLISFTSLISPFYAVLAECTEWATRAGAEEEAAGAFVGSFFSALAAAAAKDGYPEDGYGAMVEEAATSGGLNEQSLSLLRERGAFKAFSEACSGIYDRLGGTPPDAVEDAKEEK